MQGLDKILPQRPIGLGTLLPAAEVDAHDPKVSRLDPERIKLGWRVFVECATRISTQPLAAGTGLLREALESLYKLFGVVRDETSRLRPLRASDVVVRLRHLAGVLRLEAVPRRRHVLRPRAPPCDKPPPPPAQGLFGSMSRRGNMKVAPRRPLHSRPALTALFGRTKIVRSAALHLDLLHQLLSLGGLRQLHGEHAMLEARLDLVRVHYLGEMERALE